jgi:hypothetical protein
MIVHDFDVIGVPVPPIKADSPLVVNTDAVPTLSVSLQPFQLVSRKSRKRPEILSRIKHVQFAESLTLDSLEPAHRFTTEEPLGLGVAKGPDHR